MRKIIHNFDIKAPVSKVYQNLTSEIGLSGWWTTTVTADIKVGGEIDFVFGDIFRAIMKIIKLEENSLVVWECVGGAEEWRGGSFSFHLMDNEGLTTVTFIQDYAVEVSDAVYGRFNYNWGYYMQSLVELCETGKGKPYSA